MKQAAIPCLKGSLLGNTLKPMQTLEVILCYTVKTFMTCLLIQLGIKVLSSTYWSHYNAGIIIDFSLSDLTKDSIMCDSEHKTKLQSDLCR